MEINKKSEKIYDENCPVCLQLLYLPHLFPVCQHVFCKQCLNAINEQQTQLKCPLCRCSGDMNDVLLLQRLENKLMKDFPEQYENRKKAYQLNIKNAALNFIYGNTADRVFTGSTARQHYVWEFFIKSVGGKTEDYIQQVELKLHPTFKDPVRVIEKAPFTLKAIGWGTFNIKIKIFWKDDIGDKITELDYHLQFKERTECKLERKAKELQ